MRVNIQFFFIYEIRPPQKIFLYYAHSPEKIVIEQGVLKNMIKIVLIPYNNRCMVSCNFLHFRRLNSIGSFFLCNIYLNLALPTHVFETT